jgi:hypothetical protein
MEHYDAYSDEDSSVEGPPPPPMGPPPLNPAEQLKIFEGMAEFSNNEGDDVVLDEDDESVEVPAPSHLNREYNVKKSNKKSKIYLGSAICLLVVIGIILGVGFGTGGFGSDSSSQSNKRPPPGDPLDAAAGTRGARVKDYLVSVVDGGDEAFADPNSGESQALLWLQDRDPLQLDPEDFESHLRIDQRFSLATFWFSSDFDWFDESNWLTENECTWFGVVCETVEPSKRALADRKLQDEGQSVITKIDMEGNNLQGKLSSSIGLLQYLSELNLANNQLEGNIPASISNSDLLERLFLQGNTFNGDMGALDFSSLQNLSILDLSNNAFTGEFSDSFWMIPSLRFLVMDNNKVTGTVPGLISNLQNLG